MSLPVTYKVWEDRHRLCQDSKELQKNKVLCYSPEHAIQCCADWLIERLYVPCSVHFHPWGTVVRSPNKLTKPFDVERGDQLGRPRRG